MERERTQYDLNILKLLISKRCIYVHQKFKPCSSFVAMHTYKSIRLDTWYIVQSYSKTGVTRPLFSGEIEKRMTGRRRVSGALEVVSLHTIFYRERWR